MTAGSQNDETSGKQEGLENPSAMSKGTTENRHDVRKNHERTPVKKKVTFNPKVDVHHIPAYGKGRKVVRCKQGGTNMEYYEHRPKDPCGNMVDSLVGPEYVYRRNPSRLRRRPARYR